MSAKQIDEFVLSVLRQAECEGECLRLNGQLSRSEYVKVDKVLKGLGGKWNRSRKAHVFDGDSSEIVGDAVTAGCYVDRKQAFQFFETPDWFSDELAVRLGVNEDMRILEPSAGKGALIKAALRQGADCMKIRCVELDETYRKALSGLCPVPLVHDFLKVSPEGFGDFDGVLMNPPFTRSQDIEHVRHAFTFLKPGGRLVSVMSAGVTFRQDKRAVEFRDWLDGLGGSIDENAPDTFKASGTSVSTVTVIVDVPER